jgi:hypothetical protein
MATGSSILMFTTASRPALSTFWLLPGALSLKMICPEHKACHLSSYGIEIICGVLPPLSICAYGLMPKNRNNILLL